MIQSICESCGRSVPLVNMDLHTMCCTPRTGVGSFGTVAAARDDWQWDAQAERGPSMGITVRFRIEIKVPIIENESFRNEAVL